MNQKYKKEDILEAGGALIRKQGYHNTGINDLLKTCNIPKGSFYNFFKSKEDFAVKLIEFYGIKMLSFIENILQDQTLSPLQRIKKFYTQLIDFNAQEGWTSGCLVNNMMSEVGSLSPKLGEASDKVFWIWVETIAKCIKEGQNLGEIGTKYSSIELAEYLHTSIYGGLTRVKASKNAAPLKLIYKISMHTLSA